MIPGRCDFCGHTLMVWDLQEVELHASSPHRIARICDECRLKGSHLPGPTQVQPKSDPLWFAFDKGVRAAEDAQTAEDAAFSGPEDGSEERYARRRRKVPWASHTLWWVVHNCVAHPLIGVAPVGPLFRFHDWTSRRMHGR